MQSPLSSRELAQSIAKQIETARLERSLTLEQLGIATGIDKGQLSRFCRGQFIRESKNLRLLCKFLQISLRPPDPSPALPKDIAAQVVSLWNRSDRHRDALVQVLQALDRL